MKSYQQDGTANCYSEKGVPPPGAAVAYRRILKDPRDEPQYAERVPYIISNADGRRLIDRARMPEEMLVNRYVGLELSQPLYTVPT